MWTVTAGHEQEGAVEVYAQEMREGLFGLFRIVSRRFLQISSCSMFDLKFEEVQRGVVSFIREWDLVTSSRMSLGPPSNGFMGKLSGQSRPPLPKHCLCHSRALPCRSALEASGGWGDSYCI